MPEFQLSHAFPRNLCQKPLPGNTLDTLKHPRLFLPEHWHLYKMQGAGNFGFSLDVITLPEQHHAFYRVPASHLLLGLLVFSGLFCFFILHIFGFVFWKLLFSETCLNFSFPMLSPEISARNPYQETPWTPLSIPDFSSLSTDTSIKCRCLVILAFPWMWSPFLNNTMHFIDYRVANLYKMHVTGSFGFFPGCGHPSWTTPCIL